MAAADEAALDEAASLSRALSKARHVLLLLGSGVSASCGIPTFRGKGGLYDILEALAEREEEAGLAGEEEEEEEDDMLALSCPEMLFDVEVFRENPRPFYRVVLPLLMQGSATSAGGGGGGDGGAGAEGGLPPGGGITPGATHVFVRRLQEMGKLLRVYTQNIDGLERAAGVQEDKIVACHGTLATFSCTNTGTGQQEHRGAKGTKQNRGSRRKKKTKLCSYRNAVHAPPTGGDVLRCPQCGHVLKPDIVFFGEPLPRRVHQCLEADRDRVDLVIAIGTSLQVKPFSNILTYLNPEAPRFLINKEPLRRTATTVGTFDAMILGDCDEVVQELAFHPQTSGSSGSYRPSAAAAAAEDPWVSCAVDNRRWLAVSAVLRTSVLDTYPALLTTARTSSSTPSSSVQPRKRARTQEQPRHGQEEKADEQTVVVVVCDDCGESMPTNQLFWSCDRCFDFDLCAACYADGAHRHAAADPGHSFHVNRELMIASTRTAASADDEATRATPATADDNG